MQVITMFLQNLYQIFKSVFYIISNYKSILYKKCILIAAGYNYYGTERLYSGVDGRELEADIFIGIVYYQRLRHMVSDKFQVCFL